MPDRALYRVARLLLSSRARSCVNLKKGRTFDRITRETLLLSSGTTRKLVRKWGCRPRGNRVVPSKTSFGLRNIAWTVSVVIEKDKHGYYAYCPELEGCQTQGDTLDEVMANIREAIELYLETLSEEERKESLNKEILTTTLEVRVA